MFALRILGDAPSQVHRLKAGSVLRTKPLELGEYFLLQSFALGDEVAECGADEEAEGPVDHEKSLIGIPVARRVTRLPSIDSSAPAINPSPTTIASDMPVVLLKFSAMIDIKAKICSVIENQLMAAFLKPLCL